MRTVLLASLLIACGSKAVTAPTVGPGAQGTTTPFPVGPPLASPGERMTYRVQVRGVELAAMTLSVGDVTEVHGKRAIVVQAHARSVGLAEMVAAADDTFTSWIDIATGRSLRFQVDEFERNSRVNIEHTVADLGLREGDMVPITFQLNDGAPVPEPQKVSLPEVWDYNAFLIALRGWEGKPGTTTSLEVFRSRWLWHIDIKIDGKEKLTTELGELPALRIVASTYRLDRKGARDLTAEPRDFIVWISDDAGRVPLKVDGKTDYGEVQMDIAEYQPGTAERL